MGNFPFAIVGFDLDGTLCDSSADIAAALNHALRCAGRPVLPMAEVLTMIGRGTHSLLRQALAATGGDLDRDGFARCYADFLDFYDAHIADGTRLYPGLLDALDRLASRGVTLAIVTNKLERLSVKLVAVLGLGERFACLIGGDTVGVAKPDPAPIRAMIARCGGGRTAFVGDSIFDVRAARAAGVPVVAVNFGFHLGAVADLAADAAIDRYAELVPALERLG